MLSLKLLCLFVAIVVTKVLDLGVSSVTKLIILLYRDEQKLHPLSHRRMFCELSKFCGLEFVEHSS